MPLTNKLQSDRFKSNEQGNRQLTKLSQVTSWPDHLLSRLAMSRSLRNSARPEVVAAARGGKELRGDTFFHVHEDSGFLPWCLALVSEHAGHPPVDEEEALDLIVAHWHRGLSLLEEDLLQGGGTFHGLITVLARQAADLKHDRKDPPDSNPSASYFGAIRPITVPVGRTQKDAAPFAITLNDTRKFSNAHTAISGMSGSGKTQLAMQMLSSIAQGVDQNTGIIFIDFAKGDVAGNSAFARSIDAKVMRLPGNVLPIGAFHLPDYSDDSVRLAAEEKREVYSNLFANLGAKQQGRLVQALRSSYASLRNDIEPAPDFEYVQHMLDQLYQGDGLQPDSLTELFRRLNAYRLFWSRGSKSPVSPLHVQRWLIDIHELSGLKEITAFTIIEQLYREMRALPDSHVDAKSGLRQIRCVLAIDEAQYYLRAKNRFLQGIIREGRSKGFMVMLMCQSPDDFDQKDFDYTEQLQFTYMLQCKTEPKAVMRLLGVGRDEAKRVSMDLGKMEPLHGIGRSSAGQIGQKFRIVPFFEAVQR